MAKNKRLLHSLHHLLIGSTLIIKGADKVSHHHNVIGGLILAFGIIIIVFFFYTLFKEHLNKNLTLMVHWFEALVALFTAYVFFTEGKTYLPWVFILAAIGFLVAIYISYQREKKIV